MFAIGSLFLSIIWAIVISLFLLAILHFLTKSLFPMHSLNLGIAAILFVAAIIFFWQSVRLVGAFYIKGYVSDVAEMASGLTQSGEELLNQTTYTLADLNEIKQTVSESYPFLNEYIDGVDLKDLNTKGLLDSIKLTVYKQLNRYIWARIGWIFACLVVAFGGLYYAYSASGPKKRTTARRRSYDWD